MLTTITIARANALNDDNNKRRRTSTPKPKPLRQGDVTKKRCDQCLGAGKVPCYNCTQGGVAKCDKVGFVPKNTFTFRLPFGWTQERREDETTTKNKKKGGEKKEAEANIERCSVCSANGKLACARCNGKGNLLYRSADWRGRRRSTQTLVVKAGSSFEQKFGKDGSGAFSGGVGGGMAGQSQGEVSAQDLAILQQRLGGQQISFEGSGAQQLQQKGLIDAQGNLMSAGQKPIKSSNPDALEITYDPDGVLGDVSDENDMLIDRHLAKRDAQALEAEKEKLKEEWKKKRKELEEAREARPEPTSPAELVTYFFETEFNEMEFEILKSQMEDASVSEDMKGKIDALSTVTQNFVGFVDQTTKAMLQPKERMMKLLTAKDKKAMILEMVDNDELDMNLMALLMTNINTAKAAGLDQEAAFMQKIYSACAKFVDGA
ncbi:unnamed protein product [Bathycoccus prasinos]